MVPPTAKAAPRRGRRHRRPANLQKLDCRKRAELFDQLAVMEDSGLPVDQAFTVLTNTSQKTLNTRLTATRRELQRGLPLAEAGARTGLFDAWEASLLRAATTAGSPAGIYRQLADEYARRANRQRRLRSGLMLPAAVVVLATAVAPLPDLVGGSIDASDYVLTVGARLLYLGFLVWLLVRLPHLLRSRPLHPLGLARAWDRLVLRIPVFGRLEARRQASIFLGTLAMLLEAGIAAFDAVPLAIDSVHNAVVRQGLQQMQSNLLAGQSLSMVLRANRYVSESAAQLSLAGETAGSLPEMLRHWAQAERSALDATAAEMWRWVPRLIYLAVLIALAYGMVAPALA